MWCSNLDKLSHFFFNNLFAAQFEREAKLSRNNDYEFVDVGLAHQHTGIRARIDDHANQTINVCCLWCPTINGEYIDSYWIYVWIVWLQKMQNQSKTHTWSYSCDRIDREKTHHQTQKWATIVVKKSKSKAVIIRFRNISSP